MQGKKPCFHAVHLADLVDLDNTSEEVGEIMLASMCLDQTSCARNPPFTQHGMKTCNPGRTMETSSSWTDWERRQVQTKKKRTRGICFLDGKGHCRPFPSEGPTMDSIATTTLSGARKGGINIGRTPCSALSHTYPEWAVSFDPALTSAPPEQIPPPNYTCCRHRSCLPFSESRIT